MNRYKKASFFMIGHLGLLLIGCNMPFIPPKSTHYFSHENVENFTSAADLVMNGTNVSNYLKVSGKFEGSNSTFNNVDLNGKSNVSNSVINGAFNVNGDTTLDKVTVSQKLSAFGELKIANSWLKKPLELRGRALKIYNSIVPGIVIRASNCQTVVEIQGGTKVKGDIVFEGGKGKVFIDKKSKVTGSIVGGTIDTEDEIEINLG